MRQTFLLSATEAAYVVAALLDSINGPRPLTERDRTVMEAILFRMAAGLDLTPETRARIEELAGRGS